MKLTRRQMVGAAVAGSAVAVKGMAQAGAASPDFAKQAHDNLQRNADALAKFALPITTEPAFQFKA